MSSTINAQEASFAFIKPGFLDSYAGVHKILALSGLRIIRSKYVILSPNVVDFVYREFSNTHYYPVMKRHLTSKTSLAMIVEGLGSETLRVLSGLKKLPNGRDGPIRQQFQKDDRINDNEIDLWNLGIHPNQDDTTILLTQRNVIHTADTPEEVSYCAKEIFGLNSQSKIEKTILNLGNNALSNYFTNLSGEIC